MLSILHVFRKRIFCTYCTERPLRVTSGSNYDCALKYMKKLYLRNQKGILAGLFTS